MPLSDKDLEAIRSVIATEIYNFFLAHKEGLPQYTIGTCQEILGTVIQNQPEIKQTYEPKSIIIVHPLLG